jgi:hypothetical protein
MDSRSTTVILEQQEKKTQCCIHMIFASILLLVLIATATFVLLESSSDKLANGSQPDATKISAHEQGALGKKIDLQGKSSSHQYHDEKKGAKSTGSGHKHLKGQKKDDKKMDVSKVKTHQKPEAKPKSPKIAKEMSPKTAKKPHA